MLECALPEVCERWVFILIFTSVCSRSGITYLLRASMGVQRCYTYAFSLTLNTLSSLRVKSYYLKNHSDLPLVFLVVYGLPYGFEPVSRILLFTQGIIFPHEDGEKALTILSAGLPRCGATCYGLAKAFQLAHFFHAIHFTTLSYLSILLSLIYLCCWFVLFSVYF